MGRCPSTVATASLRCCRIEPQTKPKARHESSYSACVREMSRTRLELGSLCAKLAAVLLVQDCGTWHQRAQAINLLWAALGSRSICLSGASVCCKLLAVHTPRPRHVEQSVMSTTTGATPTPSSTYRYKYLSLVPKPRLLGESVGSIFSRLWIHHHHVPMHETSGL